MYASAAYNVYEQNNIAIESKEKLIEVLYEGVLRFNMQAKKAITEGNIEKRVYWINRSIAIISELISCLDSSQGQIAEYLDGLYSHQLQQLTFASIENDLEKIDRVNNVFKGLLAAWRESTGML